jgi:chaperonin cofactor prefoldin
MLEREEMETIRAIINDRMDKAENRIFDEMEKISTKVDSLSDGMYKTSERVSKLESSVALCEASRVEQGKRIGTIERNQAIMESEYAAIQKTRAKAAEWVKWVVSGIIALVIGVLGFLVGSK